MRERYSVALLGVWCTRDPVHTATALRNLYLYASGSPINMLDPTGRKPLVAEGRNWLAKSNGKHSCTEAQRKCIARIVKAIQRTIAERSKQRADAGNTGVVTWEAYCIRPTPCRYGFSSELICETHMQIEHAWACREQLDNCISKTLDHIAIGCGDGGECSGNRHGPGSWAGGDCVAQE